MAEPRDEVDPELVLTPLGLSGSRMLMQSPAVTTKVGEEFRVAAAVFIVVSSSGIYNCSSRPALRRSKYDSVHVDMS